MRGSVAAIRTVRPLRLMKLTALRTPLSLGRERYGSSYLATNFAPGLRTFDGQHRFLTASLAASDRARVDHPVRRRGRRRAVAETRHRRVFIVDESAEALAALDEGGGRNESTQSETRPGARGAAAGVATQEVEKCTECAGRSEKSGISSL